MNGISILKLICNKLRVGLAGGEQFPPFDRKIGEFNECIYLNAFPFSNPPFLDALSIHLYFILHFRPERPAGAKRQNNTDDQQCA